MCKFINSLSRSPEIIGAARPNKNLEMFLKPNKEGEFYRVRLIGIESKDGRRTDPHITRMVHSAWETDPSTGKKHLIKIVCSVNTPWVKTENNKKVSCKICSYTDQQWTIYNESGKSDKTACAKASKLKSTFEAIVPVYVVNDPNYEKNNGKLKVIVFNDKDKYKMFREKINAQNRVTRVFNGEQAVDCLIYVGTKDVTTKSGYVYKATVIENIKFSTKPKDIPAITSKLVDKFPFDETYFADPLPEDVDEFYKKFCAIANDDIPDDDDIPVYKPLPKQQNVKATVPANDVPAHDDISDKEVDDLLGDDSLSKDPDEDGLDVPEDDVPAAKPADDDGDDLLKELGL